MNRACTETHAAQRAFIRWGLCYLACILLILLPSLPAWFNTDFRIMDSESDFFIGLFGKSRLITGAGKGLFSILILIAGYSYYRLWRILRKNPASISCGLLAGLFAPACLLFLMVLPFFSGDVFSYLGKAWLESRYHLSTYSHNIAEIPSYESDPMFANVFHSFNFLRGSYGPLFQKLCVGLVTLSGPHVKAALLLFKLVCFLTLSGSLFLLRQINVQNNINPKFGFFLYGCNPLVLFNLLSGAHNDGLMVMCMLAALWACTREKPLLAGISLAAAAGFKLVPVILLPAFVLYYLKNKPAPGCRNRLPDFCLGFLLTLAAAFLLYPDALSFPSHQIGFSLMAHRSSIFLPILILQEITGVPLEQIASPILHFFFFVVSGLLLAGIAFRRSAFTPKMLASTSAWLFLFYLTCVLSIVSEWHLLWVFCFAACTASERNSRVILLLSVLYMPAAIFSINNTGTVLCLSQIYLWGLLLAVFCVYAQPGLLRRSGTVRFFRGRHASI